MVSNKISVLMSTYKKDDSAHLVKAVESMLKQTMKPAEIVIIEDGEIPGENQKKLNNLAKHNKCIKLIKIKNNVGLGLALRKGLLECKYDLVARMDSDDISAPDRLEKQYRAMISQNCDIVGSNISEFINNEENIVSYRKVPENDQDIKEYIKKRCPMNHMTVLFKKKSVLDCGNYEHFPYNEDYYLWVKMYEKNKKFYNLQDNLVNVRIGKDMFKRRGGKEYYNSEIKLQNYLKEKKIINNRTYVVNCMKRLIMQRILPNNIREIVYRKYARSKE